MPSRSRRVRALPIALAAFALAGPPAAAGQNLGSFLSGGAGLDTRGERAYAAQLAVLDSGESSAIELALSLFHAGLNAEYSRVEGRRTRRVTNEYKDRTEATGLGVVVNYLVGRSKERRGPYFGMGLGLGVFDTDWYRESPTNAQLGTPLAGGGSSQTENGMVPGSIANVGLGVRLHRNIDLRAEAFTLLVTATEAREDAKFLRALTLSVGLGY